MTQKKKMAPKKTGAKKNTTKKNKPQTPKQVFFEYVRVIGGALLLAITIRSIWFEPFKIPSSSMIPTLQIGDFLFVDKNEYGYRNPCTGERYKAERDPERGDIVVFERHKGPVCGLLLGLGSVNYIKRIVAVPGDYIAYINKTLYVNDDPVKLESLGEYTYSDSNGIPFTVNHYAETQGDFKHSILLHSERPAKDLPPVEVPEGMYVMMGDNRDNSMDSREWKYPQWGFVKKEDIVGPAEMIFFSWDSKFRPRLERIGQSLVTKHGE